MRRLQRDLMEFHQHYILAIKHGDFIVISPVDIVISLQNIGNVTCENWKRSNAKLPISQSANQHHSRCALKITYNISNMVSEEGVHYHHLTLKQKSHSGIFPRKHDKSRNETRMLARQGIWNLCVVHPLDNPNSWDMKKGCIIIVYDDVCMPDVASCSTL